MVVVSKMVEIYKDVAMTTFFPHQYECVFAELYECNDYVDMNCSQ